METLLVIEDSKAMQRVIQRLFKAESFTVEMAADGAAGLQALTPSPPEPAGNGKRWEPYWWAGKSTSAWLRRSDDWQAARSC